MGFLKSWPAQRIQWWDVTPLSMSVDLTQTHGSCGSSFGQSGAVALLKAHGTAPRQRQSQAERTTVPTPLLGSTGTFLSQVNTCTAARCPFRELSSLKIKYPLSVKTFKFQMLTGMIWGLCVLLKRGTEPHFLFPALNYFLL